MIDPNEFDGLSLVEAIDRIEGSSRWSEARGHYGTVILLPPNAAGPDWSVQLAKQIQDGRLRKLFAVLGSGAMCVAAEGGYESEFEPQAVPSSFWSTVPWKLERRPERLIAMPGGIPAPPAYHKPRIIAAAATRAPQERAATRAELDGKYIDHRDSFLAQHARYPSREEDRAWGRVQTPKAGQRRIEELRIAHIPEEARHGGRGKNLLK